MNLYDSAEAGDLERVQVLLKEGVDKDQTGTCDETPLYIASEYDHIAVV